MNSERKKFYGSRQSLMGPPTTTNKTPTRRFGSAAHLMTPANGRESARFSIGVGGGASARRISHFTGKAAPAVKIDTSDKRLQQEMIQKIHEYLVELDGDDALTVQQITKPTTKEFVDIVEMIYESVAPNYELKGKKLIEEVPRLFSALGYPYAIKASTLQTVGATHSWHYLLHALCWLIDHVKMANDLKQNVGPSVLLGNEAENSTVRAFRYSWLSTKFKEYQKNKGTPGYTENREAQVSELRTWFESQEDVGGQLRAAHDAIAALQKENQEMEKDKGREAKIREDISLVEDDIRKASQYATSVEQAESFAKAEKEAAVFETAEVRSEVEGLKGDVEEKKRQIAEQEKGDHGIKGEEARGIMTEYDRNRILLREMRVEMDGLSRDHWVNQPKVNEAFATVYSRYRQVIGKVHNIRSEFLGEKNEPEPKVDTIRELQIRIRDDARVLVERTYSDMENEKRRVEKEIQQLMQKKKHIENAALVESERLEEIERRGKRQNLANEREMQERRKDRKMLQNHIDALERDKETLKNQQHDVAALNQDLIAMQRKCEEVSRTLAERTALLEDDILEKLRAPVDLLASYQRDRETLENQMNVFAEGDYDFSISIKENR